MNSFSPTAVCAPDTNILMLFLVAQTDLSLLRSFKRVQSFDATDADFLLVILRRFRGMATTPHVLAETSNFIDQAPRYRRALLVERLRDFIRTQDEVYEDARYLAGRDEFDTLGLSDTALSSLSSRITVITTDYELSGKILRAGGLAINFRQVRYQQS